MDLNVVLLCGRLAAPPELRRLDSGASLLRLLIAVRSEVPTRRLDLVPVICWKPPADLFDLQSNERVLVTGMLQRRFWDEPIDGRGSSIQVVAEQVDRRPTDRDLVI